MGLVDVLILVRLQELLDLYQSKGVNEKNIFECRGSLLNTSKGSLASILNNERHPGLPYFSLKKFYQQNSTHMGTVKEMFAENIAVAKGSGIRTSLLNEAEQLIK